MVKNYLKCDSVRALFPDQRAVGYPDVVTVQGFVGVILYFVVSVLHLHQERH